MHSKHRATFRFWDAGAGETGDVVLQFKRNRCIDIFGSVPIIKGIADILPVKSWRNAEEISIRLVVKCTVQIVGVALEGNITGGQRRSANWVSVSITAVIY